MVLTERNTSSVKYRGDLRVRASREQRFFLPLTGGAGHIFVAARMRVDLFQQTGAEPCFTTEAL